MTCDEFARRRPFDVMPDDQNVKKGVATMSFTVANKAVLVTGANRSLSGLLSSTSLPASFVLRRARGARLDADRASRA